MAFLLPFPFSSLLIFLLSLSPSPDHAATFTTNALIIEANSSYDGQDIVVSGATLTVDGRHYFNSLLLTNGAVLTHSPCTTTNTHKLDLVVTNEIMVSTNSRIDVTGRGYLPGRTTGNTTVGGTTGVGGGSYGGLGGKWDDTQVPNAVYGDYADPDDWGSGGGWGAAGGGLVRIEAARLTLDGQVLADGSAGGSGGSGGGIYVAVGVLEGNGLIRAGGGGPGVGQSYCAGGGGRIAVYAQDYSGFNLAAITTPGGQASQPGGAGTVYVRDTDDPRGTLVIEQGTSGGAGITPLGLAGTNSYVIDDDVVIRGSNTTVRAEHAGMAIAFLAACRTYVCVLNPTLYDSIWRVLIFSEGVLMVQNSRFSRKTA